MKQFKKIVAGVDYSDSSRSALKQAGRIAQDEDSELVALHVVIPSEIEEYAKYYTISTEAMLAAFRSGIAGVVEKDLGSADAARCEAVLGLPYHELIDWCDKHGNDLLVLGSHGRSAHPHGIGFFAAKCVRHSKIPVLLTRSRHETPFKRVAACIDFSTMTDEVLTMAARIAADEGAELHVIHAVSPPWMRGTHVLYNLQTPEDDAYKAQFREVLSEQMEAACKALPVEAKAHTLEHSNASQAVLHCLNEIDADLAVVGRSGKSIKQFLIGTTAERLIHRSPCSVLVIPNA